MASSQLDLIMSWVQQLPANEQLQLIKRVADLLERADKERHVEEQLTTMANGEQPRPEAFPPNDRALARAASLRDFTADRQWLADHRDEYAGQWVALKFGRLISHGAKAKEVHQARARRWPFGCAAGIGRTQRSASIHPLTMPHQLTFAIRESYDTRLEGITIEARLGLGANSVICQAKIDTGPYQEHV